MLPLWTSCLTGDLFVSRVSLWKRTSANTRTPTTQRTRFLAKLVGAIGRWFHFAGRVGRGRRAMAFGDIPSRGSIRWGALKGGARWDKNNARIAEGTK